MITYEHALVAPLVLNKNRENKELLLALIHRDLNDTEGTYFIKEVDGKYFRECVQANVLSFISRKPDYMEKKGVMRLVPAETYSELTQTAANNRLYCFLKRQNVLLKNASFCEVLVDQFDLPRNGLIAVEAVDELLQSDNMPTPLFSLVQKITGNNFLTLKAVNIMRTVLSYRSKYAPKKIRELLTRFEDMYPDPVERGLFFDALACMNSALLQKRILDIKMTAIKIIDSNNQDDGKIYDGWDVNETNDEVIYGETE